MPHSRPQVATTTQVKTHRRAFTLMTLLVAILIPIGYWLLTLPGRWLRQAGDILVSAPAKADALAADVITLGFGNQNQAWLLRCRANLAQKNPLEALGAYAQIKHPQQCDVSGWCALIEEAQAANHAVLAEMALTEVLRFKSDRARVLTLALPLKASSLAEQKVLELVEELRHLAGSRADCWLAVGLTEQARGRLAEAVETYRRAIELSHDFDLVGRSSRRELAQLLIILGQFSEAEPLVTEMLQVSSPLNEDLLRLAQLRRSTGNWEEAERILKEFLENDSGNLSALLLRGIVLADQEKLTSAQADFEHCLSIAPFHDETHYRLSQVLFRLGDSSKATEHLQESQRLSELKRRVLEINRRRETAAQDPVLMDKLADLFEALGQPITSEQWRRSAQIARTRHHSGL